MLTVSVKYDIAPLNVHHVVLTNTLLNFSPISVCTSPAALTSTWTMTATTRTTMTGTVRKLLMLAHTPYCLSVCHRRLNVDSSSLLSPVVSVPCRCLPHNCQSSFYSTVRSSHMMHTHSKIYTVFSTWSCTLTAKTPKLCNLTQTKFHLALFSSDYIIGLSRINVKLDVALNFRVNILSIYSKI